MKSHSELISKLQENMKREQDYLSTTLQNERSEVLQSYANSLRRGLSSIEKDIASRLQRLQVAFRNLEEFRSKWIWAHVLNACILIVLVIVSVLVGGLVREQWGLFHLQGQLASVINSSQIYGNQILVPVEAGSYYTDQSGQLYAVVSMKKEK